MWEFNYFTGNISLRSAYLPSHKFNYLGTLLPRSPMADTGQRELRSRPDEVLVPPVGLEPTLEGF